MQDVRDTIDDIIDNFDFNKVEKVMTALSWKWVNNGTQQQPEISEMRKYARKLINSIVNRIDEDNKTYTSACGGFRVSAIREDGKFYIQLAFEVTTWDNYL